MIPPNLIVRERPGRRLKGKPQLKLAMFKDTPYLLTTAGLFFAFWGVYFGFYYIVAYAQQKLAFSASEAVNLLILMVIISLSPLPTTPLSSKSSPLQC